MENRVPAKSYKPAGRGPSVLNVEPKRGAISDVASAVDRIAHDFNNFLGVVISNLDLLERKMAPEEKASRCSRRALEAALQASEYTAELLSFSRKGKGSLALTNFNSVVQASAREFQRETPPKKIELRTILDDGLGCVYVNRTDLERALRQVLRNSLEAIEAQGKILIKTGQVSKPGDPPGQRGLFFVEIADSGSGMDAKTLEKCIQPFFTSKGGNGQKGLGLNQVLGFVLRAGGDFKMKSTPGVGTAVRLELPRRSLEESGSEIF